MKSKSVAKKTMDDPELQNMFNQMMGVSDPDPTIIAPKYESILESSKSIVGLLQKTFVDSSFIPKSIVDDFNTAFDQIKSFCISANNELDQLTLVKKEGLLAGRDMKKINSDPELMTAFLKGLDHGYTPSELGETYKKLKDCSTIDNIVIAARDLRSHLETDKSINKKQIHDLEDKESLSDSFIKKYDGDFLQLIPSICILDFKQMWLHDDCNDLLKNRIKYTLHLFLKKAMTIVQHIMSPDIDVSKFSEILVSNIDELRKHIPRCDKAFNKIKQSVGLLSTNFSGYYKDFVTSKNPGIIVENFVLDVASDSKADRETTMQFKRIVAFYRKKMQGNIKDPKIQKIFDLVGENLNILEKKTGQSYKKTKSDESPDGSPSESTSTPNNKDSSESAPKPEKTPEEIAEHAERERQAYLADTLVMKKSPQKSPQKPSKSKGKSKSRR